MLPGSPSPMRLLVVEHDIGVRELLEAFLTAEGYDITLATSPEEALALLDEQLFHLVLADLFSTNARDRFGFVEQLRASIHSVPIGVITGWNVREEEIAQHGVTFLMRKPFEMEDLLASIAACLNMPLRSQEAHQAEVVRRFLAAASRAAWEEVAALCTDDVSYTLPGHSPLSGTINGITALCAYLEAGLSHFPALRIEEVLVYPRPHGVAARYEMRWRAADGSAQHLIAALLLELVGERISRIGARVNEERLTAVVAQSRQAHLQISGVLEPLPPRVLLVDPDEGWRESLALALLQEGYEVARTPSLETARVVLEERCFHLLLADLPGGPQVGSQLQQLLQLARPTPVAC